MQNFGKIKNTFNNLLAEGIANKTNKEKAIFSKFVKLIKESDILKTQFNIYYDIEHKVEPNEFKSSEFVKESISLIKKFKQEDILKENQKLINILNKYKINIDEDTYNNSELHEHISKLIFTKKNSGSISTIVETLEKVVKHVKENTEIVKTNNNVMPNSFYGSIISEKFNAKYADLSDDEKTIIKTIIESNDDEKKTLLNTLATECLGLVNVKLKESNDVNEKEALLNVKEALLNMEYIDESFINDVGRIIDLKKAFND